MVGMVGWVVECCWGDVPLLNGLIATCDVCEIPCIANRRSEHFNGYSLNNKCECECVLVETYHIIPKDGKMANWLYWSCCEMPVWFLKWAIDLALIKITTNSLQRTTGLATRVVCTANMGVLIMHVKGSAEICVEHSDCYVLIRCESTEKPKVYPSVGSERAQLFACCELGPACINVMMWSRWTPVICIVLVLVLMCWCGLWVKARDLQYVGACVDLLMWSGGY